MITTEQWKMFAEMSLPTEEAKYMCFYAELNNTIAIWINRSGRYQYMNDIIEIPKIDILKAVYPHFKDTFHATDIMSEILGGKE